ncbi:PRC-barrel domain-containing protein [Kineococcus auxinigenes]|uniref:PRC-barrel domain-containing protein n=1 Tax=unclassified Kineococcus TaxID=2621656 RepID=UPI003D7D56CD
MSDRPGSHPAARAGEEPARRRGTHPAGVLVRLGDTTGTVADPAEDVRGRRVLDGAGAELGTVDDLLVDGEQQRVRMLRLKHGGVLGIGAEVSFVPVEAITATTDEEVRVDLDRERVSGAPRYDPDLADQSEFYDSLYGYYGYTPFWGPGYVARPWPYPGADPV